MTQPTEINAPLAVLSVKSLGTLREELINSGKQEKRLLCYLMSWLKIRLKIMSQSHLFVQVQVSDRVKPHI